jgi:hypothetical protein
MTDLRQATERACQHARWTRPARPGTSHPTRSCRPRRAKHRRHTSRTQERQSGANEPDECDSQRDHHARDRSSDQAGNELSDSTDIVTNKCRGYHGTKRCGCYEHNDQRKRGDNRLPARPLVDRSAPAGGAHGGSVTATEPRVKGESSRSTHQRRPPALWLRRRASLIDEQPGRWQLMRVTAGCDSGSHI